MLVVTNQGRKNLREQAGSLWRRALAITLVSAVGSAMLTGLPASPASSTPVEMLAQHPKSGDTFATRSTLAAMDESQAEAPPLFFECSRVVTFDDGNEGWRAATTTDGTQINLAPQPVGWTPTGGNPGGALIEDDLDTNWTELWTPEFAANGFVTDYSFAIGQSLQFDYKNNTGIDYDIYVGVVGVNGSFYWFNFRDQIVDSTRWTRVIVPMDAAQWHISFNNNSGPVGAAPTPGDFAAALSEVDRFTFSIEGQNGPDQTAFDNFGQQCDDFGDAPAPYATTAAAGGPSHRAVNYDPVTGTAPLMLGSTIDIEEDGQPTANADGDDITGRQDEDGVSQPIQIVTGEPVTLTVSETNETSEPATLAGWIDLNGNGVFDANERAVATVPAGSGTADYPLTFAGATATVDTYARFRLFPGEVDPANALPNGTTVAGEVEDYAVTVIYRSLKIEKTSDATIDTRVGDTITYTVTATNVGTDDYTIGDPAVVLDDLSGVLDDAAYNSDAAANRVGTVGFADPLLSWTGALAADDSVELTYTVTLQAGGDGVVRNVAWVPADPANPQTPACDPPTTNGVDPATGEPCAPNEFLFSDVAVTKSSDPGSGTEVNPSEEISYTLTFSNGGINPDAADVAVDYTDYLADVLDDATLTSGPTVSNAALTATVAGETIRVTGAVPTGETYTVTYTVKVSAYDEQGNHQLINIVAATGEAPVCAPGAVLCTEHSTAQPPTPGGTLVTTGGESPIALLLAVFLLLGAGGAVILIGRRSNADEA